MQYGLGQASYIEHAVHAARSLARLADTRLTVQERAPLLGHERTCNKANNPVEHGSEVLLGPALLLQPPSAALTDELNAGSQGAAGGNEVVHLGAVAGSDA